MNNIFLFRHGDCFSPDSEYEKLSPDGIMQAKKAGEIVAEKLNECYTGLKMKHSGVAELEGILKVHSGRLRASQFLEILLEIVEKKFDGEKLGFYGNQINIISPEIYSASDGDKSLLKIINRCSSLAGIQAIVGHNPGIVKVAKDYVDNGFDFIGDNVFLKGTREGGGYYINTPEKTICSINQ